MYTDEKKVDRVEVFEDGTLQIREVICVYKDGVLIANEYHRSILTPVDDTTKSDSRVKAIADAVWTDDVKKAYTEKQKTLIERMEV